MNPAFHSFRKQVTHPLKFRLFLLQKLPAAFFAGLRIKALDEQHAVIAVRHTWFNRNPFRSMYFAVQSMAAEMSTGLLASGQIYQRKPPVSMLVVGIEARFVMKITGLAYFTCNDGELISAIIEEAIITKEPRTISCRSTGTNTSGETVAEFIVTWSFKSK
jgi:hypothetical protein